MAQLVCYPKMKNFREFLNNTHISRYMRDYRGITLKLKTSSTDSS